MAPRLSRWIALGCGSGLSPIMPGTAGTLWAWLVFVLLDPFLNDLTWGALIVSSFGLGIWACERTARDLGVSDPGCLVWDEVVAFWAVLLLVPGGTGMQTAAFFLFRFFDIVKPPPIRAMDRSIRGGLGVMADDLMAAAFTVLVLALWVRA